MQDAPTTAPPKPKAATGTCQVTGQDSNQVFTVDLDAMTCDCQHGEPWYLPSRGVTWKPRNLCNHKLKAIASLCTAHPKDALLRDYYDEQLGKRYNAFEITSAFHKELRRGDVNKAQYWATMLTAHRGRIGVINYMRNILFEECRDISLSRYILRLASHGRSVTLLDTQRAIARFCAAPKKWELPWRLDIFMDEQRAYKRLAAKYTYDVAKGRDIIPEKDTPELRQALLDGFASGDRVQLQYGLKGWVKSKSPDHDEMKIDILNVLIDVMNGDFKNAFEYDHEYALDVHSLIMRYMTNHGGVRYHYLNALADALSGEPGNDPRASLPLTKHKTLTNYPKARRIRLGGFKTIPLYAHDNHTWGGKAKIRNHRNQLEPGADQRDLDFRLCGAYMGVAWRLLAVKQHGTIDCKWSAVQWKPKWLWTHLDGMFY